MTTDDKKIENQTPKPKEGDIHSCLVFEVSSDNMEVHLRVVESLPHKIQIKDVVSILNQKGVKYGFDQAKLLASLEDFNTNYLKIKGRGLLVATGSPPGESQNGRIEFLIKESMQMHFDKQGRADFRNIEKYKQINKGTILARRTPPVKGKSGYNIYGESVESIEPLDPFLECGENVSFDEVANEYCAEEKGIFSRDGEKISISPVLLIEGNVGIETGNLIYDGSIHVEGNVERGALLSSSGEIQVNGFIESNLLRVGKSLFIGKGVNAQEDNIIHVGKNLECNYVDNSKVMLLGSAKIKRSINASCLSIHGDLEMLAENSIIVGGEIIVFGSIITNQIGNNRGTKTVIIIGYHDANNKYYNTYVKECESLEKEYNILYKEILEYKKQAQNSFRISPSEKEKINTTHKKYVNIQKSIKILEKKRDDYRNVKYNKSPVSLTARQVIHPGVEIFYRNYKETVKSPITSVTMEFSPDSQKPLVKSYTRPT